MRGETTNFSPAFRKFVPFCVGSSDFPSTEGAAMLKPRAQPWDKFRRV